MYLEKNKITTKLIRYKEIKNDEHPEVAEANNWARQAKFWK